MRNEKTLEGTLRKPENLRKRALLNAITGGLDYGTKLLVGFFLNPIMVSVLGSILFGAWQVIGQLNSYMATADIRAATSLKFILSRDRSINTDSELRKTVSSALYANAVFIPLYLVVGCLISWFSPVVAGVTLDYYLTVRIATAFLVVSFITTQFFFLFESTLHGMNLAYKRIGIRAIITILGGGLTAGVLYKGYGIVGMAVVQIVISTATGLSFWWIIKRNIPWFGFTKVAAKDVLSFIKLSGWFMLMKFADLISQSIDMILLGYLAGPKHVASYAITKYSMNAVAGLVRTMSTSASVGINKFIGERKFDVLLEARKQLFTIQWVLIAVGGTLICAFNQSFIMLWTKGDLFSGQAETFLIVLIACTTVLYQTDGAIISATLDVRRKILYTLFAAAVTIFLSVILVPYLVTLGLLIAILAGCVVTLVCNGVLVRHITSGTGIFRSLVFSRTACVGLFLISISNIFPRYLDINNWSQLGLFIIVAGAFFGTTMWGLGMNNVERQVVLNSIMKTRK